jgi:hypothetical protein
MGIEISHNLRCDLDDVLLDGHHHGSSRSGHLLRDDLAGLGLGLGLRVESRHRPERTVNSAARM